MSTTDLFVAIGSHLRAARENTGQSVEYVADVLRIKPGYIADLEAGNLDRMPGRPYILGFLRSYSDYLGLDTEALVHEVRVVLDDRRPVVEVEKSQGPRAERSARAPLIAASILVVVAGLGGWSYWRSLPDDQAERLAQAPIDWLQGGQGGPVQDVEDTDTASSSETLEIDQATETEIATSLPGLSDPEDTDAGNSDVVIDILPPSDESNEDRQEIATIELIEQVEADAAARQNDVDAAALREPSGTVSTQTNEASVATTEEAQVDRIVDEELARLDRALEAADAVLREANERAGLDDAGDASPSGRTVAATESEEPTDDLADAEELIASLTDELEVAPQTRRSPNNPSEALAAQFEDRQPTNRVQLFAEADSWIEVRNEDRSYSRQQLMRSGETLLLPDDELLTLKTGNAGGLVIILDGEKLPVLGVNGEVVRDVSLTPVSLRQRFAGN